MRKRWKKFLLCTVFAALLVPVLAVPAMATGDVAGAIQSTWTTAQTQIRAVVDNVVFPVIDMILAMLNLELHILNTKNMGSLSLLLLPSCSPA